MQFTSADTGYCHFLLEGGGVPQGAVFKTKNGGKSWQNSLLGHTRDFHFLNNEVGFAVYTSDGGFTVETFKTVNGGNDWSFVDYFEPDNFSSLDEPFVIDYCDETHGLMAYTGKIYKTSPDGAYWKEIYSAYDFHYMTDIEYFSPDTFLITTFESYPSHSAILMWSYDGGDSFEFDTLSEYLTYPNSIYYRDQSTAFMPFENYNTILKSIDGGHSWYETIVNDPNNSSYKNISFPSKDTGYAVGYGNYTTLLKTTDGGENWDPIDIPCTSGLSHVVFQDDLHGRVFGNHGVILETHSGGVVNVDEFQYVANQKGLVVYPNPTKDILHIELPKTSDRNFIVEVFNLKGERLLKENVPTVSTQQTININVASLKRGIYFCRVKNGTATKTSKIVKF